MVNSDLVQFSKMWLKACEGKKRPTDQAIEWYFDVLQDRDLRAIGTALIAHARNPDNGQFAPQPADIIRYLDGGTVDAGKRAWSKVLHAIKHVGPYQSPVFDDPVTHRVIQDMGGWIELNNVTDKDLPFVEKDFATRYASFAARGLDTYPARLEGLVEQHNSAQGMKTPDPVLVGDPESAVAVAEAGSLGSPVSITRGSELIKQILERKQSQQQSKAKFYLVDDSAA